MNHTHNEKLTPFSQKLRREMTKEEKHLWYDFLKKLPLTFNRQKVIGCYIVDFYCAQAKLVIELDGNQHGMPESLERDAKRDEYMNSLGLTVLRYSNLKIQRKFSDVCREIYHHLPLPQEDDAESLF